MKKLRLDPEVLRVETFEPREREAREGTVLGQEETGINDSCITQCVTYGCECLLTVPVENCG